MYFKMKIIFLSLFFSFNTFSAQEFTCEDMEKKFSVVGSIGTGDSLLGPVYVYNHGLEQEYQLSEFSVSHFWIDRNQGEIRLRSYDMMEDKDRVVLVVNEGRGTVSLDYKIEAVSELKRVSSLDVKVEKLEVSCNF